MGPLSVNPLPTGMTSPRMQGQRREGIPRQQSARFGIEPATTTALGCCGISACGCLLPIIAIPLAIIGVIGKIAKGLIGKAKNS